MIRAFLNSNELTLFPDTAIGLTIENFNISDMTNRKIDRTNIIRVPKAGNEATFEFSSIPNAPTDFAYQDFDFDLIVDGINIYENGRAFIIGDDDDSYTLNVTNNKNIIDLLKSINLADLYTGETITLANTGNWENLFKQATNGFRIDYMFRRGNPAADTFGSVSGLTTVSIYVTTIIAKLVADYDITFSGDLLSDADYLEFRLPMVNGNIRRNIPATDYLLDEIIIHGSFTAWDLIKNILQLTCSVFKVTGTNMEIHKFNDIDTTNPVDWSGRLVSKSKKFAIPGTAQKNYIRHNVGENVDPLYLAGIIDCNNKNIDFEKDLATMKDKTFQLRDVFDNYTNASAEPLFAIQLPDVKDVPNTPSTVSPVGYTGVTDMQIIVDSAKFLGQPLAISMTFLSFVAGTWVYDIENGSLTSDSETTIAEYYDPTPNYSLIETMLTDPVFYEVELLLNILDLHQEILAISNVSDCENSPGFPYETFSGISPTGFTAINTSGAGQCGTADEIVMASGDQFRVTFNLVLNSGQLPTVRMCVSIDGACNIGNPTAVEGANEHIFNITSPQIGVVRFLNTSNSNYVISNLAVRKIEDALDPFNAVKIDELEGIFYVNKINNFLATSPGTPTKVELIKIS